MGDDRPAFDPSKYLSKVGGADYLEVKYRILWLRTRHPDAEIDTQLVQETGDAAIFKATVRLPGGGSATGYGSETYSDFRDYLEKAESKALGRALAALGFGTQFCPDYEFEGGSGNRLKVVDSPIEFASTRGRRLADASPAPGNSQTVTPKQLKFIQAIAREAGLSEQGVREDVQGSFGCAVEELTRKDASEYIERLQALRGRQDTDAPQTQPEAPERVKPAPRTNHIPKTAPMLTGDQIIAEYREKIEAAPTYDDLYKIGEEMTSAGISDDGLKAAYRARKTAFQSTS